MDVLHTAQHLHSQFCEVATAASLIETDADSELFLPVLRQVKELLERMEQEGVPFVTVQEVFHLFLRDTIPHVTFRLADNASSHTDIQGCIDQADADELFDRSDRARIVSTPAFRAYQTLHKCWHQVLLLWDMLRASAVAGFVTDSQTLEYLSEEYYRSIFVDSASALAWFLVKSEEQTGTDDHLVVRFFNLSPYPLLPSWETIISRLA